VIGARYEFQRELGGGGMAVVYEVIDRQHGRRLALKRLHHHVRVERDKRARSLFEHEYHTLAQLRHPRIVQVFDYALDEQGPFYTMELLDGGDLLQLARAGYARVCQTAADVCSALSLLHSRRLLHRDVSPRNIRCTSDGTAKLIDFGVMTHVGPSKDLVGTPAYAAPELVNLQPLDARTDLYGLGASLYFALTGRNAYPARSFADLPQLWRRSIPRPSELDHSVPEALDTLVLDLLQLDPKARPASAAEVLDRLAALVGHAYAQAAPVEAQAYLTTPAYVGREPELSRIRAKLQRARGQRGGAALVAAAPGFGRSRFLDSVVLSGKLLGMTVLRAYAEQAEPGEYCAVHALLTQLKAAVPDATARALQDVMPVLGHIAPELAVGTELQHFEDRSALRPQLQHALRKVLRAVSAEQPILIAIDDLPLLDEPSVAALALLAREVDDVALQLVATAPADYATAEDSAFRLYTELASRVSLHALTHKQAHALLVSVFGETTHLDSLVDQLMQRTHGNPRDLMRLSQHLVDRGVVRYHAGAWSLPARVDTSDLPASIAQVLHATASKLDAPARVLAGTFALCPDYSFTFEECRVVSGCKDPSELAWQLGQLVTAEVLRGTGERYALNDRAYVPVLLSLMSKAETETAHARLAEALGTRPDESFRVAQHLLRAGRPTEALEVFVAHAIESQTLTERDPDAFYKLVRSLPEDWLSIYEEALALAQALKRPQAQLYALRSRLAGIVGATGLRVTSHVADLVHDLARASGLKDYEALDASLAPGERLRRALAIAQARFDAASEHDRILEPIEAIGALARNTLTAVGMYAPVLDPASVRALPSVEPLALLTPALSLTAQLSEGVYARLTGRMDRALAIYNAALERMAEPDQAGLNPSQHRFTRMIVMSVIAMIEASMGLSSCLRWAAQLESDPLSQVSALQVRVLHRLWQGDCLQAEREQREVDARRIESGARQNQEKTHLLWQVTAHAGMEDLTRLRRTLEEIRRIGESFPGWRPVISYATAEYQRARGDLRRAIVELQDTLATVQVGEHQIWPHLAAAHVRALDDARRSAYAVRAGRAHCEAAERAELGFSARYIALPLAVAEAKQGLPEAAARAEQVIEDFRALGTTGLSMALAYEARIRVAIAQADRAQYERYVERYEQDCLTAGGEAIAAKLHKLKREAQRKQLIAAPTHEGLSQQSMKSKLMTCSGAAERAHVMLAVLAASAGASEGFLYLISERGPGWVASVGSRATPSEALDRLAREFITAQTVGELDVTADIAPEEGTIEWTTLGESSYQPMLLSHYSDNGAHIVTGLLVLRVNADKKFVRSEFATQMSRVAVELGDSVPTTQVDVAATLDTDDSS
jgi:hypothetical protein